MLFRSHPAAAAGVAAALGIWVSVELLLPLALSMAALGIAWAADRVQARDGRTFAGALALSLGIAVMVERAPAAYGAIEYDKVSIVHVALAFALAALWTALAALDVQGRLSRGFFARLAACAGIAVACLAVFVGLFPRFLLGPTADVEIGRAHV